MSDELKPSRDDRRGAAPGPRAGTEHEGKVGNLPHVPTEETRRQVRELAALQVTQAEIATVMGFSTDTIARHYRAEFDEGRAAQGIKLRRHAYELAYGVRKNPDKPEEGYTVPPESKMVTFLLERQHGMIERRDNHHSIGEVSPEAAEWLGRKPIS